MLQINFLAMLQDWDWKASTPEHMLAHNTCILSPCSMFSYMLICQLVIIITLLRSPADTLIIPRFITCRQCLVDFYFALCVLICFQVSIFFGIGLLLGSHYSGCSGFLSLPNISCSFNNPMSSISTSISSPYVSAWWRVRWQFKTH